MTAVVCGHHDRNEDLSTIKNRAPVARIERPVVLPCSFTLCDCTAIDDAGSWLLAGASRRRASVKLLHRGRSPAPSYASDARSPCPQRCCTVLQYAGRDHDISPAFLACVLPRGLPRR